MKSGYLQLKLGKYTYVLNKLGIFKLITIIDNGIKMSQPCPD